MKKELFVRLAGANFKEAAFDIMKHSQNTVLKKDVARAINLFVTLPCLETAIYLANTFPLILPVIITADESMARFTPKDLRGPMLTGYEESMATFDAHLFAASRIQSFLMREALAQQTTVGFHRMRNQASLLHRLNQVGFSKPFLSNSRQFLRDTITTKLSAYRAVIDLVCIHGFHDGRDRFWNGLGTESDARFYLYSEILFNVSPAVGAFSEMSEGFIKTGLSEFRPWEYE